MKSLCAIIIGLTGFWLVVDSVGPGLALGLLLVVWGNNIGVSKT